MPAEAAATAADEVAEAAADKPKLASGEPKPLLPELPPRGRMVVSGLALKAMKAALLAAVLLDSRLLAEDLGMDELVN